MSELAETSHSETTTEPTNGAAATTNGGKPPKEVKVSILDKLHAQWEKNGSKDPSKKDSAAMVADYKAKLKVATTAQQALDKATAEADAAAAKLVAEHGRNIELALEDGVNVPACYGDKVYFKRAATVVRKVL